MNVQIPVKWLQELLALCGPEDHELRERVMVSITAMDEQAARAVAVPDGWREKFAADVYADLAAADNQDVPLEEYPARILKVLDSIVGPRHPVVIKWRNDAIRNCIAIAYKYCRDPESHKYLKQDLEAMLTTEPAPQAPADALATATGLPAQAVEPLDIVQAAADAASVGHLSHLIDYQSQILARAMAAMKAVELTASPIDEPHGDLDARIPYEAWATFVDARAALLYDVKRSPVAAPQAQTGFVTAEAYDRLQALCDSQAARILAFEDAKPVHWRAVLDPERAAQAAQGGEHDGAK